MVLTDIQEEHPFTDIGLNGINTLFVTSVNRQISQSFSDKLLFDTGSLVASGSYTTYNPNDGTLRYQYFDISSFNLQQYPVVYSKPYLNGATDRAWLLGNPIWCNGQKWGENEHECCNNAVFTQGGCTYQYIVQYLGHISLSGKSVNYRCDVKVYVSGSVWLDV